MGNSFPNANREQNRPERFAMFKKIKYYRSYEYATRNWRNFAVSRILEAGDALLTFILFIVIGMSIYVFLHF